MSSAASVSTAVIPSIPYPLLETVPDSAITASSYFAPEADASHAPVHSRLNAPNVTGCGAWAAAVNDTLQGIMVDLGFPHLITEILVKGRGTGEVHRGGEGQRVTSYLLDYAVASGGEWIPVQARSPPGSPPRFIFRGPEAPFVTESNRNFKPFVARYVRLSPVTWVEHISLRWDVVGLPTLSEESKTS